MKFTVLLFILAFAILSESRIERVGRHPRGLSDLFSWGKSSKISSPKSSSSSTSFLSRASNPSYPPSSGLSGSGSRISSNKNYGWSLPSSPSRSTFSRQPANNPSYPSSSGLSGIGSLFSKPSTSRHQQSSSSKKVGWSSPSSGQQPANNPHYSPSSGFFSNFFNSERAHSYPSSTGLSGKSKVSSHSYPKSSGLSGSSSNIPSYPSSSGLSGKSEAGSPSYPKSGGLSGTSSNIPSYPKSNGLSGSRQKNTTSFLSSGGSGFFGKFLQSEGTHSYPSSSGLSGKSNANSPSYPKSSGLSGSGNNNMPSYPASSGLSGTGFGKFNNPSPTYNFNAPSFSHGIHPPPVYSGYNPPMHPGFIGSSPIHVSHSNTGSGMSNLLGGLAYWAMSRPRSSHRVNHYHHSYTNDKTPSQKKDDKSPIPLNCTLTLLNSNGTNTVEIPCEIATSLASSANVTSPSSTVLNQSLSDSCIITVVIKKAVEKTTIPCSFLMNSHANSSQSPPISVTYSAPLASYPPSPSNYFEDFSTSKPTSKTIDIPLSNMSPSPAKFTYSAPLASFPPSTPQYLDDNLSPSKSTIQVKLNDDLEFIPLAKIPPSSIKATYNVPLSPYLASSPNYFDDFSSPSSPSYESNKGSSSVPLIDLKSYSTAVPPSQNIKH